MQKMSEVQEISTFCKTLNTKILTKLSKKDQEESLDILDGLQVYLDKIPKDKIHIYYMLLAYLKPVTVIDYIPKFPKPKVNFICDYLAKYPLPQQAIRLLFSTVYNNMVLAGLKPDISNLSNDYIKQMFVVVDRVYFNNGIQGYMNDAGNLGITFEINNKLTKTSGVCTKRGCIYYIKLGKKVYTSPFKKFSKQTVNGLFCYNPLMCILNVFLHEVTHLITFMYCSDAAIGDGHGKIFQNIVLNYFGQTEYKHKLGIETPNVMVTKDMVDINQKVWWRLPQTGKIYSGHISQRNPKTVSVGSWKIPYYMLILEKPDEEDIEEIVNINDIKNNIKIGQTIWWKDSKGNIYSDIVVKKNPKLLKGKKYGVPYSIILLKEPIGANKPIVTRKSTRKTTSTRKPVSQPKETVIKVGRLVKIPGEYLYYDIGKITNINGDNITIMIMNDVGYADKEIIPRQKIMGNPTKQETQAYKREVKRLIANF